MGDWSRPARAQSHAHAFDAKDNAKADADADADADIGSGKLHTRAMFDRAFDKALLSNLDSRWIETDTMTWYPIIEEPHRHFGAAAEAYVKKDYPTAATEIRKATSCVRLEAGRASGAAPQRLDRSARELDALAHAAAKGVVKDGAALKLAGCSTLSQGMGGGELDVKGKPKVPLRFSWTSNDGGISGGMAATLPNTTYSGGFVQIPHTRPNALRWDRCGPVGTRAGATGRLGAAPIRWPSVPTTLPASRVTTPARPSRP